MSRHRVTLLVNPASNNGAGARTGRRVADLLSDRVDLQVLCGSSAAESTALLAEALRGPIDAVFVCGGDGIAHLAVNVLAESSVPLGIIPAGSGNDAATALGMPSDPTRAAELLADALVAGSSARIDLGRCDTGQWWLGMLYAGFDSAVNERANALRWPSGRRRYDVAIAAELRHLRPRGLRLSLDDTVLDVDATLVAVGNGPQYGGGKLMTPDAQLDDGLFDITVVGRVSRLTLVRLARVLPTAGHLGHPAVSRHRARTVSLELPSGADLVCYADGERIGPLPVRTTCVPGALTVLMPVDVRPPALSESYPG